MFPSFSSRHGFLFDLLAPWLPSSSGVIATSSPAQLGTAWVEPRGFRCVGGQLDCQIGRKLGVSLDFGRADLALNATLNLLSWVGVIKMKNPLSDSLMYKQFLPGNSTCLIPASKLSRCCSSCCCLIAQKSSTKKAALGHRIAATTVGLLRSPSCPGNGFCMYWFHYSASQATCPDEGGKQTSEYQKSDCIPFNSYKIQVVEFWPCRLLTRIDGQQTKPLMNLLIVNSVFMCFRIPICHVLDWGFVVWTADVTHRHFHHLTFLPRKVSPKRSRLRSFRETSS